MSFHVGQKVVCINDDWTHPLRRLVGTVPRKGAIYHVRGFDRFAPAFIYLVEIVNMVPPTFTSEPAFLAESFRPIVERKTDISIFTKLLAPNPDARVITPNIPHDTPVA